MKTPWLSITLMFGLLSASGCAAIGDLADHQRVYGGTRFTAEYLSNSDGPWKRHQGWKLIVFYPILAPCLILDLPFTAIVDTGALPYTVSEAVDAG